MLKVIFVVLLDWIDFPLSPSSAEVTGIGQLRNTWSSRMICCQPWRSSRGRASLKLHSPEQSDIERRYAWRHCNELNSSTEQQHLDCRCRQLELNWGWLVERCMLADRAIQPLSLHWTQLRIRHRSLRWSCTPKFRLPWDCSIAEFEAVTDRSKLKGLERRLLNGWMVLTGRLHNWCCSPWFP